MKLIAVFLLFAVVNSQQTRTVTEDLLESQRDLTIGHEFSELLLAQNRGRLSNYLAIMEEQIVDSFMDGYSGIKNIALETRQSMQEFPEEPCEDTVRARYELQVSRYGQKLSQCLKVADGYLRSFTQTLNDLHDEGRAFTNKIPNSSVNVLSRTDAFDSRDNLQAYISSVFRELLFESFAAIDEFEDFVGDISEYRDEYVSQLTSCFKSLPRAFENESMQDLESIAEC